MTHMRGHMTADHVITESHSGRKGVKQHGYKKRKKNCFPQLNSGFLGTILYMSKYPFIAFLTILPLLNKNYFHK